MPKRGFGNRALSEAEWGTFLVRHFVRDQRAKTLGVQKGERYVDPWAMAGLFLGRLWEFRGNHPTQRELEKLSGYGNSSISNYFKGKTSTDLAFDKLLKPLVLGIPESASEEVISLCDWFLRVGMGYIGTQPPEVPALFDPATLKYPAPWTYELSQEIFTLALLRVKHCGSTGTLYFVSFDRPFLPRIDNGRLTPSATNIIQIAAHGVDVYLIYPDISTKPSKQSADAFKSYLNSNRQVVPIHFLPVPPTDMSGQLFLNPITEFVYFDEVFINSTTQGGRMNYLPILHPSYTSVYPYMIPAPDELAATFKAWIATYISGQTKTHSKGSKRKLK